MDKKSIEERIIHFLQKNEDVLFAYIFGSFLTRENYRDIDIAIFFKNEPSLMMLGLLHSELTQISEKNIDVIALNGLPEKSPVMAFQVSSTGKLVKNIDEEAIVDFREKTMRYYFDTAYLRQQMSKAFEKRLDQHAFGKRNFLID